MKETYQYLELTATRRSSTVSSKFLCDITVRGLKIGLLTVDGRRVYVLMSLGAVRHELVARHGIQFGPGQTLPSEQDAKQFEQCIISQLREARRWTFSVFPALLDSPVIIDQVTWDKLRRQHLRTRKKYLAAKQQLVAAQKQLNEIHWLQRHLVNAVAILGFIEQPRKKK